MLSLINSTVAVSGFPQCKYNFELSTGSSVTGNWFRCVKFQWRSSQSSKVQKVHCLLESMCEKCKWWSSHSSKSSNGHPNGNRTIQKRFRPFLQMDRCYHYIRTNLNLNLNLNILRNSCRIFWCLKSRKYKYEAIGRISFRTKVEYSHICYVAH